MVKNIQKLAVVLIVIGLLASCYLNYFRLQSETADKTVQVLVDFDELKTLAKANALPLETLAARFKQSGATGVIVRERTLEDLQNCGDAVILKGNELALLQKTNNAILKDLQPHKGFYYILTQDKPVYEAVYAQLSAKRPDVTGGESAGIYYLSTGLPTKDLAKLGIGFIREDLLAIAEGGLAVAPRIREWPNMSRSDIDVLTGSLREMPGLALVTFNDAVLPGTNNLPYLAERLNELKVPLGMFEFFPQQGLNSLARYMDKNIFRIHSISENDMPKYTEKTAVERFNLAIAERNIRALYVRFFGMSDPAVAVERASAYLSLINENIAKEGFTSGFPAPLAGIPYTRLIMLIIGLGVIGGGLLLLSIILPAAWPARVQAAWLVLPGLLVLLGWAGFLYLSPALARKVFALLSVIIFPIIGTITFLREEKRGLANAVATLLKMSAVSFLGALIMTGLLAEKSYMLTLDIFTGVKLAHLAPLAVIPLYLIFRGTRPLERLKRILTTPLQMWHTIVGAVLLAALAVYLLRTGNEATALVSSWEIRLRDFLDQTLGVRPRSKEFLVGHPAMLVLLYYGFNLRRLALLLFGVIGQISLVNTYAHIHTPLLISFTRTFHGLWLGIVLGAVLIAAVNLLITWLRGEGFR